MNIWVYSTDTPLLHSLSEMHTHTLFSEVCVNRNASADAMWPWSHLPCWKAAGGWFLLSRLEPITHLMPKLTGAAKPQLRLAVELSLSLALVCQHFTAYTNWSEFSSCLCCSIRLSRCHTSHRRSGGLAPWWDLFFLTHPKWTLLRVSDGASLSSELKRLVADSGKLLPFMPLYEADCHIAIWWTPILLTWVTFQWVSLGKKVQLGNTVTSD